MIERVKDKLLEIIYGSPECDEDEMEFIDFMNKLMRLQLELLGVMFILHLILENL